MQIRLRRWREEDGRDFDRFTCHEAIWRYMHADFPRTPAQCEAAVRALVHADPRRMFVRAIEIEGHAAGGISLCWGKDRAWADATYWLAERYWNRGVMRTVLKSVCASAFGAYPELTAVWARPTARDRASRAMLERAGFRFVAREQDEQDGIRTDCFLYALRREDIL